MTMTTKMETTTKVGMTVPINDGIVSGGGGEDEEIGRVEEEDREVDTAIRRSSPTRPSNMR